MAVRRETMLTPLRLCKKKTVGRKRSVSSRGSVLTASMQWLPFPYGFLDSYTHESDRRCSKTRLWTSKKRDANQLATHTSFTCLSQREKNKTHSQKKHEQKQMPSATKRLWGRPWRVCRNGVSCCRVVVDFSCSETLCRGFVHSAESVVVDFSSR